MSKQKIRYMKALCRIMNEFTRVARLDNDEGLPYEVSEEYLKSKLQNINAAFKSVEVG